MNINFDEYRRYSDRTSVIFKGSITESNQCDNGHDCSSGKNILCTWVNKEIWEMTKTCFPDAKQINKCPESTLCKECTYVQEEKY